MKYSINDGFPYYIELVQDRDYKNLFYARDNFILLESLNESQARYRYADDKWSIKQVVGHMTDHERIMIYRALRFSRNDKTPLPGYDQNVLVDNSRFDEQSITQLVNDFSNVRKASLSFIESLSADQLLRTGQAWKYELTVEEFLKATIGHELHHMNIIKERYLDK